MPPGPDDTWADPADPRPTFGVFRFYFADQRWEWSDELAVMHGYRPGSVHPTTELVLSHKHPADRAAVSEAVANAVATGAPFSSRHRIIDTAGAVRSVVVVGDRIVEGDRAIGSFGVYVDLTSAVQTEVSSSLDRVLPRLTASREGIDCAKGMIMLVYGLSADRAFDLLRWRSQQSNVKIRVLAQRLIDDVGAAGPDLVPSSTRTAFDHLLLADVGREAAAAED